LRARRSCRQGTRGRSQEPGRRCTCEKCVATYCQVVGLCLAMGRCLSSRAPPLLVVRSSAVHEIRARDPLPMEAAFSRLRRQLACERVHGIPKRCPTFVAALGSGARRTLPEVVAVRQRTLLPPYV